VVVLPAALEEFVLQHVLAPRWERAASSAGAAIT
jgi:hypothetical protein